MNADKNIFEKARETIKKKNSDYTASSSDIFKNFTSSAVFGVDPVRGIQMRMMDKFQRLKTMALKGKLEVSESALDSCEDLINYAVLMCGIIHQSQDTEPITLDGLLVMHRDICTESSRFMKDVEGVEESCVIITPIEYLLQQCVDKIFNFNNAKTTGEALLFEAFNLSVFIVSRITKISLLLSK